MMIPFELVSVNSILLQNRPYGLFFYCCNLILQCASIIKNKKVGKLIYKAFAFLGTISLELYCVQEFLGAKIVPLLNDKMGHFLINIVLFAVVLIAAIILSVLGKLFWKVFDGVHERLFVK